MTTLFWQKRPSKKLIAALLFVILTFIIFLCRVPIAIKSIEYFAKSQNLEITCLDFSVDWRLNLKIEKACVTSPLGTLLVRQAKWQTWSNVLSIGQLEVKHLVDKNSVKDEPISEQTYGLNLPESLPKISISSLKVDSVALLQPLHVGVNTLSSNELVITGDVNVSIKMHQNRLMGTVQWSLADLTKWIPQAKTLSQDNAALLKDLALNDSKILTSVTFDGKSLSADSRLEITNRFEVTDCPIDAVFKGHVVVDVDIANLTISLDLSQFSNDLLLNNCPLIKDYFAADDIPQLSFVFPQKITIDEIQINLPKLLILDKQNALRNIELNDLFYKTTGELDVNYKVSVKQAVQTTPIQNGIFDYQGSGAVSANLSMLDTQQPAQSINLNIISDNNRLVVNDLKVDSLLVKNISSVFTFHHSSAKQLELKGAINSSDITINATKLAKTKSDFLLSGTSFADLQLSLDNQLSQLARPDMSVKSISNHLNLNMKELNLLRFAGDSTITNLTAQNIKLMPIVVAHKGQANLADMTVSSEHKMALEQGFEVVLGQQESKLNIQVEQQDILALKKIISQLEKDLTLSQGEFSASIKFALPQEGEPFFASGTAEFEDVFAKYQDYMLNNMHYQTPLKFDSAGLQLTESTLHIDSIDVGVIIEQLEANIVAQNSVFRFKEAKGNIFNGKFSLANLWLDGRDQQFNVKFQNIELAQLVALQEQPGINITGNIDGNLPIIMDKQGIRIEDGWMSSITGGKLSIAGNPSFDSIKLQQPQLALLENLDFTQLKSDVLLKPNGEMVFDFSIKGNNPEKKQAVNFNYNHQQNLFALLELKRLVKSVENKIEQKITEGNKK